jgi:hypothetical protein
MDTCIYSIWLIKLQFGTFSSEISDMACNWWAFLRRLNLVVSLTLGYCNSGGLIFLVLFIRFSTLFVLLQGWSQVRSFTHQVLSTWAQKPRLISNLFIAIWHSRETAFLSSRDEKHGPMDPSYTHLQLLQRWATFISRHYLEEQSGTLHRLNVSLQSPQSAPFVPRTLSQVSSPSPASVPATPTAIWFFPQYTPGNSVPRLPNLD